MLSLLKNRKFRDTGLQIAFVGFLVLIVVTFIITARNNLDAQGLTSGFDFLNRATGWSINFSLVEYSTGSTYSRAILVGFLNSMFVGTISLTLATVIGVAVGVMRTSGNAMAEMVGTMYVELFRNVPLLLQLFAWYAILTALPNPKQATVILNSIYLTGRGTYFPGLNISSAMGFFGDCHSDSRRYYCFMAKHRAVCSWNTSSPKNQIQTPDLEHRSGCNCNYDGFGPYSQYRTDEYTFSKGVEYSRWYSCFPGACWRALSQFQSTAERISPRLYVPDSNSVAKGAGRGCPCPGAKSLAHL